MILAHLAACTATLIAAGIDSSYRDCIQGTFGTGAALPLWFSLQGISTILLFGVAVMILPLYKFHVQLIRNNTTTYKFLTDKARNIAGKGGGDRGTVFPEDEMGIDASRMSVCRAMCSIFETAPRQPIGDEAKLDHLMSQADRCPPLPVEEEMKETEDTSESLQPPAEEVNAIELKELTV